MKLDAGLSPEQQRVQATVQALWHPDTARDPYPAYEAVRALDPLGVVSPAGWGAAFATSHALNSAVLRSPAARSGALISQVPADTASIRLLQDRKSTRLNSSHVSESRMPSSA